MNSDGCSAERWGFHGIVITDFAGLPDYMDIKAGLQAGTDMWMNTNETSFDLGDYKNDPQIMTYLRNAAHDICYTVNHSVAMNGLSETSKLVNITPLWMKWMYTLDAVVAVLAVGCIYWMVRRNKDEQMHPENYKPSKNINATWINSNTQRGGGYPPAPRFSLFIVRSQAMKHADIIQTLSLEQKCALLSGGTVFTTRALPGKGIPAITLSDGPNGVRKQAGAADHLGLNPSVPACFPTSATVANSLGPGAWRGCGRSHGRRSSGTGRVGAAGPRPEHQAQPAVRPQLRVFLGGSLPCR